MVSINIVLLLSVAFLNGGLVIWLYISSRQAKKQLAKAEGQNRAANDLNETLHTGITNLERNNSALSAQVDGLALTIGKLEEKERQLESERNAKQNEVNIALESKATAETSLSEAGKTIVELQRREKAAKFEADEFQKRNESLKEINAELQAKHEETVKRLSEQEEFIKDAQTKLKEAFGLLSADALRKNNESFVELAKAKLDEKLAETKGEMEKKEQAIDALVKPLSDSLTKFDTKIQDFEKVRFEQHGQVNQFILGVQQSTEKLQKETHNLVSALKTSHVRGKYGEIALRRVVEFAGMTEHCDFEEQSSVQTEEGLLRPDMNILLPEGKSIVVDAKTPLAAYMRAFETEDEDERNTCLVQHALAVKEHLKKLSAKGYWSQFSDSPDYVILYMQIESSFGTALQFDPTLIEEGIRSKIVFATPTTLITLLRTVGFVWQQRSVAENIELIRDAGIELYNRTTTLMKHFGSIGNSLKGAVTHYNSAVASLESRFIPQANKLYTLGSAYTKNIMPEIDQIEITPRLLEEVKEEINELSEEEMIVAAMQLEQ